jgi:hypothetical protein
MTKTIASFITFLGFLVGPLLLADENSPSDSPGAALKAYFEALKKGDLEAAKGLTAAFKNLPPEYLEQYTAKYSEGAKAGKLNIKLVPKSSRVDKDCAVVTFEDGNKERPDYDPAYLIKQDGQWKVFLKLTKWEHRAFETTEEQKNRFKELEEWFDKEKDRLYGR